ncbi:sugar isomerase [Robertkochia marina]|uniref:Sugar isomerase n=1 Tax=Robertkochia marina TaxID=1227945 RepID=A0A4S3M0P0_9FLAO|nr:oligosaccharide flippase family protein [Robertkochia marina]THD67597.1 sugar isomerase [Robertkochia marina]TRZ44534.1 sugar isomerase [Robertkochia marina]
MTTLQIPYTKIEIKGSQVFMLSALIVNAGNYIYNLLLGRILGPEAFADAAILVTFLLILSFMAMTLQLSVAKFTGSFNNKKKDTLLRYSRKWSLLVGSFLGVFIIILAGNLQEWFNTSSAHMFRIFGMGVPIYFLMSVNRGYFQGKQEFIKLSITYQGEMFSRLFLTLAFILILPFQSSELVSLGILISLLPGMLPYKKIRANLLPDINSKELSHLKKFMMVTAFYELSQVLINNGDILLVKHFFDAHSAGLYSSMALIGRAVYFVAWMFVMLLLPEVVKRQKEGKNTQKVFGKYLGMISILVVSVVLINVLFPRLIIEILFGSAYMEVAGILWKYALASSLFALANVFVYYFLSLDKYLPVIISAIFGVLQLTVIAVEHSSLEAVVEAQIFVMGVLLILQTGYFLYKNNPFPIKQSYSHFDHH